MGICVSVCVWVGIDYNEMGLEKRVMNDIWIWEIRIKICLVGNNNPLGV